MKRVIRLVRKANRAAIAAVLVVMLVGASFAFSFSASAHSSSWCQHSTKNDDGTHYIVYKGGEWISGTHYHSYEHWFLIGNYDHSAFKQCPH